MTVRAPGIAPARRWGTGSTMGGRHGDGNRRGRQESLRTPGIAAGAASPSAPRKGQRRGERAYRPSEAGGAVRAGGRRRLGQEVVALVSSHGSAAKERNVRLPRRLETEANGRDIGGDPQNSQVNGGLVRAAR